MSSNSRSKTRKVSAAGRRTMLLIIGVVLVLMVVLFVAGSNLGKKIETNENRVQALEELIKEEEQEAAAIEELDEYMQSDEYIEETAKEKLGMVKDGEIIFTEGG